MRQNFVYKFCKKLLCCEQFLARFSMLHESSVWDFHARWAKFFTFFKKFACMDAICEFSCKVFLTTAYHRHFFRFPILLKRLFKCGWKRFFLNQKDSLFIYFLFFNFHKFCDFFAKKLFMIKVEDIWNIIIWYAFYSKLTTFTDFEKNDVFQKTLVLYVFEKSYHFSCIRWQIFYNLVLKNSKVRIWAFARITFNKRKQKCNALNGWVSFHVINMGEK